VGLTEEQVDRAVGAVVASAAGDALGVPYEFGSAVYPGFPAMVGGGLGGFAPGEWSDDTAQACAILDVAASGADLRSESALDRIAQNFADWFAGGPPDVGVQTHAVLSLAGPRPLAASMSAAAAEVHARTGRSAGNGSLMRTVPVVLAHLGDPDALVEAAVRISVLTHHDPLAGDASAVWCLMLRQTILEGSFPTVVPQVGNTRDWPAVLREAETQSPSSFSDNAWVVGAMQAAWSAICHTEVPEGDPQRHLQLAIAQAIEIGHDTDTVAAIAGGMLGARWGFGAVPSGWVDMLHGWPGLTGHDLATLARRTVTRTSGSQTRAR
jgi:ADP-ribosylglycohydrolase